MPVPGPASLGRGVVIAEGGAIPPPWISASVVSIGEAELADPAEVVARLHQAWADREPLVVELAVDPARFREPVSVDGDAWALGPLAEPWFDRLHFLVWANTYDARSGTPIWWWGRKAVRLGAVETAEVDAPADVQLPDGSPAWIDGGPRQPWAADMVGGAAVVPAEEVDAGRLTVAPLPVSPKADLAADQLAAVSHLSGPCRVVAPAGSGKTRVLTERLRHLLGDRAWHREHVLAVAYNKEAQLELERRTAEFRPRVRTLNSLGLWVLTEHQGRAPAVASDRDCRRLVEQLLPGRRRHRANTDPIGPYLEALSSIRLGLRDPSEVEGSRDDVDGVAELFGPYRAALAEQGTVDFDEQVYGAVSVLLADGPLRRRLQQRCRHLLVDEMQDLTPAHVLLLRLLALPALDVFGVGDDDQVIYGHAGADPGFLIDFATLFPGAASHPLTTNHRCPVPVVDGARTLLGYNRRRVPKEIVAGPASNPDPDALQVVHHDPNGAGRAVVDVVERWRSELGEGSEERIAVLARVGSVLLGPQVALAEAGIPVRSILRPDVLERTGMRAALAYLRLATADGHMAAADIVEVLRRPTRGLPQWFPDRLGRRSSWSVGSVRAIAGQVPDKEAAKVERLADDLAAVTAAAHGGTTRQVLEVVRDDVGLGSAMGMLDHTGGGQGSSHLDDLEGLLGVADLHPDPAGFEPWLRDLIGRPSDPEGVLLSTVHRVKGREWPRVVVFGVSEGVVPHRLADDVEEERRVLHVAITRAIEQVVVLADGARPSPFLAELAGTAAEPLRQAPRTPAPGTTRAARSAPPPEELTGVAAEAETVLREWRARRSKADGVPAYVVLSDAHLRGIASAQPSDAAGLLGCPGIGPTKLDRYGDEILACLDQVSA